MEQENMSPLRAWMMEDMRIRGIGDKAQKSHIRAIKDFAKFLGRLPDTATSDDLRAYQLHLTDTGGDTLDLQHANCGAARFRGFRRPTGATGPSNSSGPPAIVRT